MIRIITGKVRSIANVVKLDKSYSGEDVLTATYLINRIRTWALDNGSNNPYKAWENRRTKLNY